MNLRRPNSNDATRSANRSRSVVPMSGLCSRCIDGCTGNCEVFRATFRGRELIYPGPFGDITAGGDKIAADTVVLALGVMANRELELALSNKPWALYCVGDCDIPGNIMSGVHRAFHLARQL